MSRDLIVAARRVAAMSDGELIIFARHDPDMIRDLAKKLVDSDERAAKIARDHKELDLT